MKGKWQDKVFAVGGVLLGVALVPMLFSEPAPWTTSLLTGGVLGIYAATFMSLKLCLSTATVGINSLMWLVILIRALV